MHLVILPMQHIILLFNLQFLVSECVHAKINRCRLLIELPLLLINRIRPLINRRVSKFNPALHLTNQALPLTNRCGTMNYQKFPLINRQLSLTHGIRILFNLCLLVINRIRTINHLQSFYHITLQFYRNRQPTIQTRVLNLRSSQFSK